MASAPVDPLQTLQAALSVQANSKEQADLLATLRESLEARPAPIPILVDTLIGIAVNAGDSLLKRWILDLLQFAICRSNLTLEQRTQMSLKALETLARLLDDPAIPVVKTVVQCMTTVYPLLFRQLCQNRNNPGTWNILSASKTRILELLWQPATNLGIKISAMKFAQRVILVQTRGISDPRLQNKNDPNLSNCPSDHPFIPTAKLEAEGQKLLEGLITMLYSSQDVDMLTALLNSWSSLAKLRPAMMQLLVPTLKGWTPAALANLSAFQVKSVEKGVRILLVNISRLPGSSQFGPQINEALQQQGQRMERAAFEEKKRRAAIASGAADTRKRPPTTPSEPTEAKRPKLENDSAAPSAPSAASILSTFDFTSLPPALITELIVANLDALSEAALTALVQAYRQTLPPPPPPANVPSTSIPAPSASIPRPTGPPSNVPNQRRSPEPERTSTPTQQPLSSTMPPPEVKEEPVDPLKMAIDDEEIEFEPDKINDELSGGIPGQDAQASGVEDELTFNLPLGEFKLPAPPEWEEDDRGKVISKSLTRIWDGAVELKAFGETIPADSSQAGGHSATELWMLLIVRMITRAAKPPEEDLEVKDEMKSGNDAASVVDEWYSRQDQLRQTICDYIMTDFPARVRLATTWMNEEWYNDQLRSAKDTNWRPNYDIWLNQIVASYQTVLDGRDRTFGRFLLDLPSVPADVLDLLRDLCVDSESSDRKQVGYTTLRGLVNDRPSLRNEALTVLLELTTHPDRKTRAMAINTVKMWVPNTQPMVGIIQDFALQMLRKLQLAPSPEPANVEKTKSTNGDASASPQEGINQPSESTPPEASDESKMDEDKPSEQPQEQDMNVENGQMPTESEALVHTPYLPDRVDLPADKQQVLQHVELPFALSVKVPELLEAIFLAYGQMDVSVQGQVKDLITALIRALGSGNAKLLTLLRTCPAGAEDLALRVLTIFTESGRPSAQLVALVKGLISERDLDARFLIPIIAEMDKSDIVRYLPRIVSILNGQPEPKNLVRSVFGSIVTTPPQTFGSVTSNLPRARLNESLSPAELMVLLHESEKEIGLKSAIEAIGICFSMTDVFRSEVLAVVMQQIMDEPVLPVLFLRTVIQAVTTYKSLIGFVSTTLLSRLITKKIWTNPPLWEGFIRCAKVTAPSSFGALLQLPKDQLRELVDKQPSLKAGLRDHVTKKAPNKARLAGFLDIFGEVPSETKASPGSTPQPEPNSGVETPSTPAEPDS
ncbi:Symplekin tight junction protein C terminal-domain-containing protein [Coprinopsis sp. MPI-PUGE-AT-0042]|nr:Symplekin tight junction protein C terminal-domain-containing protein [Coprinopsis sp. MPI-PUGE-AT-0042]